MKRPVALAILVAAALALATTAGAQVIYVPHDKVATAWDKGGAFADAPGMVVHVTLRDKAAAVEGHAKTTHIWYIIAGEATFMTGGTVVGQKSTPTGDFAGTDLQGGQAHHLTKGDVIVVPAGTPHWWKEVKAPISYYAVNVELAKPLATTK
jgi:mannose-6-phosphate isomerase-like protein (cupin superfamily)